MPPSSGIRQSEELLLSLLDLSLIHISTGAGFDLFQHCGGGGDHAHIDIQMRRRNIQLDALDRVCLLYTSAARIFKCARAVLLGGRVLIGNAGAVYRIVQLGGIAPDKVNIRNVFKPAELEVHELIASVEFPYAVVARIRLVCRDFERVDIGLSLIHI